MGVPFAIASAYEPTAWPKDEALDGIPNLGKPTSPGKLIAAVTEMLNTAG